MSRPALERFWEKVDETSGCWLWTAYRGQDGYGRFKVDQRAVLAHRFAYEALVGPIPEGLDIDHLCRVRQCVNPKHLEAVTRHENLIRGKTTLTALNTAKTHCPAGHPYEGSNLLLWSGQGRRCRVCKNVQTRRYRNSPLRQHEVDLVDLPESIAS